VSPEAAQELRSRTADASEALRAVEENVARVIRGKPEAIRLAVTTLVARGHLLIEDIPGVGKTTLARALARSLGGTFKRIQFTSDLLPSDIVGISMLDTETRRFDFHRGPIFANVVLADEINRTTPRTQSALLEAMSEGRVSVDEHTHELDRPFMVLATQNPVEHFGTYPLPESQMDRFLLRIRLGYPARDHERDILLNHGMSDPVDSIEPVIDHDTVLALQASVESVRVEDSLVDYALRVVEQTRDTPALTIGVSTRGALAWFRAAQALAVVDGRDFCIPDDFKGLAVPALSHRVTLASAQDSLGGQREESEQVIRDVLSRVPVPT